MMQEACPAAPTLFLVVTPMQTSSIHIQLSTQNWNTENSKVDATEGREDMILQAKICKSNHIAKTEGVFSWWKNLNFNNISYFVATWQIISNYKLISRLCN